MGTVTRLGARRSGFRTPVRRQAIFLLTKTVQTDSGHRSYFPVVKRRRRHVGHSSLAIAGVENEWSYVARTPIRLRGVDRDNFKFRLSLFCRGEYNIKKNTEEIDCGL